MPVAERKKFKFTYNNNMNNNVIIIMGMRLLHC